VDADAFLGTAAGALYGNEDLMKAAAANPDSLMIALMECATLGHRPGTDEYYLTPRKDHGKPRILGIEGYRGVIERMYRSGAVAKVVVREVCANDPFRYVEGADRVPYHEIGGQGTTGGDFFGARGDRRRGEMVGVYAYAELLNGAVSRVVLLSRDDVFAARDAGGYSGPDDKFSPWNRLDAGRDHPEFTGRSMWWKTGAKRLEPWVPTSAEYRREQLRASAAAVSDRPSATAGPPPGPGYVDAEIVGEDAGEAPPPPAMITKTQRRRLYAGLKELQLTDRAEALDAISRWAGRPVASTSELTEAEAADVESRLTEARQAARAQQNDAPPPPSEPPGDEPEARP
jgi:recombination protein RecT